MTEIWFKTKNYSHKIVCVRVDKHTDKSVFVNGVRTARFSDFTCFYPNFEEAQYAVLMRLECEQENAKRGLDRATKNMQLISAMTEDQIKIED